MVTFLAPRASFADDIGRAGLHFAERPAEIFAKNSNTNELNTTEKRNGDGKRRPAWR